MAEKFAYLCVVCGTTLGGPLGWLFHQFGIRRCSRNPNVCNRCDAHLQEGRIIELSVLFADLTGFTEMTNRLGADKTYLNRSNRALAVKTILADVRYE